MNRYATLCLSILLAASPVDLEAQPSGAFVNHAGIRFVDVPAGTYLMGSCKVLDAETAAIKSENERRRFLGQSALPLVASCGAADTLAADDETPQHSVHIASFGMGTTEVTVGQFKPFLAAAGRPDLVDRYMRANRDGDDRPVRAVSWLDAQEFVAWLNATKPTSDEGRYRLPSEAEWEYACKAKGRHSFCGGDNIDLLTSPANESRLPPVGSHRANAWGLHDMSGGLIEWVQDCYHDSYHGAPANGAAWETDCQTKRLRKFTIVDVSRAPRVLRGGSWYRVADEAQAVRATFRWAGATDMAQHAQLYWGFRIARTPSARLSGPGGGTTRGIATARLVDARDGKSYATIRIGKQTWMAQNLNFQLPGSWCYDDDPRYCMANGRLYEWSAAQRACPQGWHLPTDDAWKALEREVGLSTADIDEDGWRGSSEGGALKLGGSSGFNAATAGYRRAGEKSTNLANDADFWTATETDVSRAWRRALDQSESTIGRQPWRKSDALSVRCVKA